MGDENSLLSYEELEEELKVVDKLLSRCKHCPHRCSKVKVLQVDEGQT